MRAEADKMPKSILYETGNTLGESNDRFGFKKVLSAGKCKQGSEGSDEENPETGFGEFF